MLHIETRQNDAPPIKLARPWVTGLSIAVVLAAIAGMTLSVYQRGKYLHTVAGGLAFVAVCVAAVLFLIRNSSRAVTVIADERGTTVGPTRTARILTAVMLIIGAVSGAIFGYLQFTGQISWDEPGGHRHYHGKGAWVPLLAPVLLPLLGLGCVGSLPFLLRRLFEVRSPVFVRAEPSGVRMVHSPRKQTFVAWDDIADVRRSKKVQGRDVPAAIVVVHDGRSLAAPLDTHDESVFRVGSLLRYYWQHPHRRGELVTGYAVERMELGDFEPGVDDEPAAPVVPAGRPPQAPAADTATVPARPRHALLIPVVAVIVMAAVAAFLVHSHRSEARRAATESAASRPSISAADPWARTPSDPLSEAKFIAWARSVPGVGSSSEKVLVSAAAVCTVLNAGGTVEDALTTLPPDPAALFGPMRTSFVLWSATLYCPRPGLEAH